jgi:hypothetical protein
VDAGGRIYPEPGDSTAGFILSHCLERASLTFAVGRMDVTLGRQAVHWGSGRLLRPTDFAAPLAVASLESEDRAGVDALRLRLATGMMGELDCGALAGADAHPDSSAAWVRYRTYLARTDASLLASAYRGNVMAGLDMTRPIGGTGARLEASWSRLEALTDSPAEDLLRVTSGVDWAPAADLNCAVEYGYSSRGLDDGPTRGLLESGVSLPGRHYAGLEASWQAAALLTASASGLVRLDEAGCWVASSIEYSLAQNVMLQAGCQLAFAGDSSGFRSWPDLAWTSFAAYF